VNFKDFTPLQLRCAVASVGNTFLMMQDNKGQNMYEEFFSEISTLTDEATVSSQNTRNQLTDDKAPDSRSKETPTQK
jgi:hypothetical protein